MWLLLLYHFLLVTSGFSINNEVLKSSCNQRECLRCDLSSSECVKCLHVMMVGTRECHSHCPHGFDSIWAEGQDVFGRICQERSILSMVSYREVGVIAGACIVGVLSIGILLGVFFLRNKGVKVPPDSPPRGLPRSLQDKRPKTAEMAIKGKVREEFLSRLRSLRSDAPQIFRMMAATRNRYRLSSALGHDTPSDAKTKACKAVVRDLSRVLCLLSLKEEHLKTAPKDWRALLSWTERLLARYKRQEGVTETDCNSKNERENSNEFKKNPKETRTLFMTRQERLKIEQEKRRSGSSPPLDDTQDPFEQFYQKPDGHSTIYPMTNYNNSIISRDSWDSLPKKEKFEPVKIPSIKHKEESKKHIEAKFNIFSDLLNFGNKILKIIWSQKNAKGKDIEKGSIIDNDLSKVTNSTSIFSIENEDDIASQVFFDHIEAFTFDPPEETEKITNNKPDLILSNKERCAGKRNKTKLLNEVQRKNYINNLKLYKNSKNIFLDETCRTNDKKDNKENRPSKLRRFSSSILNKDKKIARLNEDKINSKKRRPLKRQKQVEKTKRSKVQEKYKGKEYSETSGTDTLQSLGKRNNCVKNGRDNSHISSVSDYEDKYNTIGSLSSRHSMDTVDEVDNTENIECYQSHHTRQFFSDQNVHLRSNEDKNWLKLHTKLEIVTCV